MLRTPSSYLAPLKTLAQIIVEGLGLGDKPDYVSVKAMSTVIKKDTAVYMVSLITADEMSANVRRRIDVSGREMRQESRRREQRLVPMREVQQDVQQLQMGVHGVGR